MIIIYIMSPAKGPRLQGFAGALQGRCRGREGLGPAAILCSMAALEPPGKARPENSVSADSQGLVAWPVGWAPEGAGRGVGVSRVACNWHQACSKPSRLCLRSHTG